MYLWRNQVVFFNGSQMSNLSAQIQSQQNQRRKDSDDLRPAAEILGTVVGNLCSNLAIN
jgi:hypothetical protein